MNFFISPHFADLEARFPSLKDATLFLLCGANANLHQNLLKLCREKLGNSNNFFLFWKDETDTTKRLVGIYEKELEHLLLDGAYFGSEGVKEILKERPALLFSTDSFKCQTVEKAEEYAEFLCRIFAGESLRHYAETHF